MIRVLSLTALAAALTTPWDADYRILATHHLVMPVEGVNAKDIQDTFTDARSGGRVHEATDIIAPRGTPVVATDDGIIKKLFTSVRGGLTIYQFDPTETYCYYYAHLDRYALEIQDNIAVHKGQVIAFVGSTGDAAEAGPHLHFEVMRLGPEKQWWKGTDINPYPLLRAIAR